MFTATIAKIVTQFIEAGLLRPETAAGDSWFRPTEEVGPTAGASGRRQSTRREVAYSCPSEHPRSSRQCW